MYWNDEGYLLSKITYGENSIIIDVLTLNHGKCSGIVYGGSSRKIKKHLQIGNKILINCRSKNENKIDYFQTELIQAVSPIFFNDKKKISCILSATSILKIIMPDRQVNKKIFDSLERLIDSFYKDKWILSYIYWEQLLVKELGFDFNLFKDKKLNMRNQDNHFTEINKVSLKIPEIFALKENNILSNKQIKEALQFNKYIFITNFFDGNKLKIPQCRYILENYYN